MVTESSDLATLKKEKVSWFSRLTNPMLSWSNFAAKEANTDRAELPEILSHEFFAKLSTLEKQRLQQIEEYVEFDKDTIIFKEDDEAHSFYIIIDGEAKVTKQCLNEHGEMEVHDIAHCLKDSVFGEMALIDNEKRSATIRTLTKVKAYRYPFNSIKRDPMLYAALCKSASTLLSQRLRHTNETAVSSMKRELKEAKARAVLGSFMVCIFWFIGVYTLLLTTLVHLSHYLPNTTPVSILLLTVMTAMIIVTMKRTNLPLGFFGLTMTNWKKHTLQGLKYTVLICLGLTMAKWAAITYIDSLKHIPLFNLGLHVTVSHVFNVKLYIVTVLLYMVFCPTQELITRSALQSTFTQFLPGSESWKKWNSILLSNLLFSTVHSHVNLTMALLVFLPGLFWGWMFHKQKSLIAVSISHILLGVYAIFVLGII